MHTQVDGLVIPNSQAALTQLVEDAGRSQNLVQAYTVKTPEFQGHCRFSADQWVWAVDNLIDWKESGIAPDPVSFPDGDSSFEPTAWPQPL